MNKAVAITARIFTSIIYVELVIILQELENLNFFISYIQSNDTDFYITAKYN